MDSEKAFGNMWVFLPPQKKLLAGANRMGLLVGQKLLYGILGLLVNLTNHPGDFGI